MNSKILVLCDTEEEYARHMTEFLKAHKEVPWEIHTYTNIKSFLEFVEEESPELLVVAESAYSEEMRKLPVRTVLLNESGVIRWSGIRNINKYQQAENVYKEILSEYMDIAGQALPRLAVDSGTKLIGLYSPVRRCLQTSFALAMAQMLAEKHRTLYLNFEHYAGITDLLPDIQTRDLADLMYFLNSDKDKFLLRMQTILQKKGRLDYIPPVKAGMNLLEITADEWLEMLGRIAESGDYEYIILDLSESIQGLFQILRRCCKIFTLTKEDRAAKGKITQYEQVLAMCEYDDILQKTNKFKIPRMRKLPDGVEALTRGELADYVREIVEEVAE